nr:helix-turn-helix transcriptional regulator [Parabacteroides goldsteinii]
MKGFEFYNTPEGDVMIREGNELRKLIESDRKFISEFLQTIMDFYPEAFKALCSEYVTSKLNRTYYEFLIVRRFIKCNFGKYDNKLDISNGGTFNFEFMDCPLRGECKYDRCICQPKFSTKLTDREREIMKLIFDRYKIEEIADKLHISIETVKNHRKNALRRLDLRSTTDFIDYAHNNNMFG